MVTHALLTSADLAEDPGTRPVKAEQDRLCWGWTPLERVGPLRYGMSAYRAAGPAWRLPRQSMVHASMNSGLHVLSRMC